ncbi:transcriptional regulator [Turicimonas muris]|uniref:transcriptional regulator n=1 Tax=Turicimonas muris TaxID=1796652 RepID=UPI0025B6DAED|nr:YdaS family helix-turn-helix protein [Turicimonas muris]
MKLRDYCSYLKQNGVEHPREHLASLLKVKKGTVDSYITGRRQIPIKKCQEVAKVTDSVVRCEELRPDFDWEFFKNLKKNSEIVEQAS